MRILVVTPTFFPIVGGAELLIRDVCNVWAERHEVRVLTPRLPETSRDFWVAGPLHASCRFETVRFEDARSLMSWRGHKLLRGLIPPMSLSAFSAIRREARAFRPDVLVTFFGVPFGLPSALVKLVARVPLVLVLCGNDLPGPRTRSLPHWADWLRLATAIADRTVYVSRFCFEALHSRAFDDRRDSVIYGGVDDSGLRAGGGDAAGLRRRLGLGPDDVMLFALQRLGREKRVDVLIHALASIADESRRVVLVIGGKGPEAEPLRRLAEELGVRDRVVFAGHLGPEKASYYEAADIFVFHSLFETFGQVLAEAMTFGKPVVSVRAGAVPEVMEEGVTGLLADPEDPAGLASAVVRLVEDPRLRKTMGEAGRERAARLFEWTGVSREWDELLSFVAVRERDVPATDRVLPTDAGAHGASEPGR